MPDDGTVEYCLIHHCIRVRKPGETEWNLDPETYEGITSGETESRMGPYCDVHTKDVVSS